jgi:uncharacterized protein (TIGR03437 family)
MPDDETQGQQLYRNLAAQRIGERNFPYTRPVRVALLALASMCPALAAEADALAISRTIQERHFPHFSILDPIFDGPASNQIVSYTRCGDSALWTGHYLAAEAFRYAVTGSADAIANARRAFAGIQSLVDVTGNNVLARCLVPDDSPYAQGIQNEEAPNGIYHSAPGNFWVGNTSRDQYSGVMFGLGVAYDLVDDQGLKAAIAGVVTRMVQFLKDHGWTVVLPDGTITTTFINRPDQQLAFLQLARHVNPDQFSTSYDISRLLLSPGVIAPISFDVLSDDSYFKFNLDTINLYTLIHLESSTFGDIYRKAYDILRNHTDDHGNAAFNMIDRALNGPNPARDAETRLLLEQWLQRSRRDVFVDNHGKYPACGDQACNPIPVPDRVSTDYLWQRSPFQFSGGGSGLIENAGIDYLLPYWMGRYYGVIAADNLKIVSAASSTPALAPGAIASIFGINLASSTDSSSAQPPPQSLDGVTVRVKDSSGVPRLAGIYFVSPGQINFVMPDEMTVGTASVTIQTSGGQSITTSADVRAVAPALFSADATGKGPASATAIQIIAERTVPVLVFTCTGSACFTAPIQLGVDTPTYLSLYGSGIRHRSSLENVTCTIGGIAVPVLYADAQSQFAGLDQVNVELTGDVRGVGESDLIVTVDGQASNAVRINVQ